jgi:hypothetical protein
MVFVGFPFVCQKGNTAESRLETLGMNLIARHKAINHICLSCQNAPKLQ